jgi:AAA15 family ATPase/GTPase
LNIYTVYDYHPRKKKDAIFFPEKDLLFEKYRDFLNDDTKDKFSVLLYGEPGTGKTSLIEAFTKEFGLSVVTAKFDDFYSEQELIDFFHNERMCSKTITYHTYSRRKCLLFEDFDADSQLVLDRKISLDANVSKNTTKEVKSESNDTEVGFDKKHSLRIWYNQKLR